MSDEPEIRSSEDFFAARDRQAAEVARDRAHAEKLWQRLEEAGDPEARRALVRADPAFQSWALCERLCDESAELADDDAERAGELVELALELAPGLDLPEARRAALLEYVGKHAANVHRARGDLVRAAEVADRAQEHFMDSMRGILPGVLERSRLSALEAALLRDRGDIAGALQKIDFALTLAGDRGANRPALYLERGRLRRRLGQTEQALEALARARQIAAGTDDERLLLRIQIEHGAVLCDLGLHGEVRGISAALRQVAQGWPTEQTRLLCLDGRLAVLKGRLPEAQAALEQACADLQARTAAGVALLLLEVAALALRQEQPAELKGLAERAQRLVDSGKLSRDAAASLKLFSRLAAQDKLTAERAAQFAKDLSRIA